MYEPLSLEEHNDVFALIKTITKKAYWIGVDDLSQEGSFTYSSSGSKIPFNLPWYDINGTPAGSRGSRYNCVWVPNVQNGDGGLWLDFDCTDTWPSVCEPE